MKAEPFSQEATYDRVLAFWIAVAAILFAAVVLLPFYFGVLQ